MVRRVYGRIVNHTRKWTQPLTHCPCAPARNSPASPPSRVFPTYSSLPSITPSHTTPKPSNFTPRHTYLGVSALNTRATVNTRTTVRAISMPSEAVNGTSPGTSPEQVKKKTSVAIAEYHLPRVVDSCSSFDGLSVSRPFIIGVAGGTASGKTSVCNKIIEELQLLELEHQGILSLSQDCFYKNLTAEERADIASFNFDHPSAFDFDEIVSTLSRLKSGQPVDIPMYDFVTSARLPECTYVPQADAILFDGILAFYHPDLRDLFDLKIFVDTDADTRLARRIRRDIVERGRDVLQVLNQYERTVKPGFESHVRPTKKHADIIVPRGGDNTVAIDLILQHIRMKMMMKHVAHSSSNGFAS